jgi:hypothetical protein
MDFAGTACADPASREAQEWLLGDGALPYFFRCGTTPF